MRTATRRTRRSRRRTCADGAFYIPFVPADDPSSPIYEQTPSLTRTEFNQFNTNEVQAAYTERGRDRPAAVRDADREPGARTRLRRGGEQRPDPRLLARHRAPGHVSSRTGSRSSNSVPARHRQLAAERGQLGAADPDPPRLRAAGRQLPAHRRARRDGRHPGGLPGGDLLADGAEPAGEVREGVLLHGDDRERGHDPACERRQAAGYGRAGVHHDPHRQRGHQRRRDRADRCRRSSTRRWRSRPSTSASTSTTSVRPGHHPGEAHPRAASPRRSPRSTSRTCPTTSPGVDRVGTDVGTGNPLNITAGSGVPRSSTRRVSRTTPRRTPACAADHRRPLGGQPARLAVGPVRPGHRLLARRHQDRQPGGPRPTRCNLDPAYAGTQAWASRRARRRLLPGRLHRAPSTVCPGLQPAALRPTTASTDAEQRRPAGRVKSNFEPGGRDRPGRRATRRSSTTWDAQGTGTGRLDRAGGTRSAPSRPGRSSCGPSTTCPTWPPTG